MWARAATASCAFMVMGYAVHMSSKPVVSKWADQYAWAITARRLLGWPVKMQLPEPVLAAGTAPSL